MKNNFQKSRNIRIFISSTFQDMQSERDMLVNKVFPRLRQIAYERNVTLTEVCDGESPKKKQSQAKWWKYAWTRYGIHTRFSSDY